MTNVTVTIPTGPIVDDRGQVTPAWRALFVALLGRTGGVPGQTVDGLQANIDAEQAARIAADSAEAVARSSAVAAEATTRAAADATLLPIAALGPQWMATNLGALPTANPGGGRPWLSGGVIHVG